MMTRTLPLIALLLLSGCAGARLQPMDAAPMAVAPHFDMGGTAVSHADPVTEWWTLFDDATLTSLIQRALDQNRDLRVAEANVDRARALIGEARSQRLPATSIGAGGGAVRPVGGPTDSALTGTASFSWEVDLFGRVTNMIRAAKADADAAEAAYNNVRLAIIAATASAYAQSCGYGQSLDAANKALKAARDTLRLTQVKQEIGVSSPLDTARAAAQAEALGAIVPRLEAQRKASLLALTTLIGETPSAIPAEAEICRTVPQVRQTIPVGDGETLLIRRPDVREASERLKRAAAEVGVAAADLVPRITIGGQAETAGAAGDLFQSSTTSFAVGPLISWTFPNIMAARARLKASEAANRGALAAYEGTMLTALSETETALSDYQYGLEYRSALQRATQEAREAARIVRLRYDVGSEDFLAVLDAERTWANAELDLAQAEADVAQLQVNLFRALGGGWQEG